MSTPRDYFSQPQGIHYCSPAHGGWGVVRTVLLVPEIHLLFVCPAACGRHGALAAIEQGIKSQISYLCIDEVDIVTGDYEELVSRAATEVIERLPRRPRGLVIFVSCLDDLLATDYQAMLENLSERHGIPVKLGRMNPIMSDTDTPPAVAVQRNMYSLLEERPVRTDIVNLMGVFAPLDPESELFSFLAASGRTKVHSLPLCKTHDDFLEMGHASLNLVLRPEALYAARDLKERLGIDYCFTPVSYRLETIGRQYAEIGDKLGAAPYSFERDAEKAKEAVASALKAVNGRDVYVDASAFCRPFNMARALIEYGFSVKGVYADKLPAFEKDSFEWLLENASGVPIVKTEHHTMVKEVGARDGGVALGFNAGYITGSEGVVPLEFDEGMFGYRGVVRLMGMVAAAAAGKADIRKMIYDYGLVV